MNIVERYKEFRSLGEARLSRLQKQIDGLNEHFKTTFANITFVITTSVLPQYERAHSRVAEGLEDDEDTQPKYPFTFKASVRAVSHPKKDGVVIENRSITFWHTRDLMRLSEKKISTVSERILKLIDERDDFFGDLVFFDTYGFGYSNTADKSATVPNAYPLAVNQPMSDEYMTPLSE